MSGISCYLFDIDGTALNGEHRLHHIQKSPKDWKAYFAACKDDKPHRHICNLIGDLLRAGRVIIYASGRPETTREDTLNSLRAYADPYLITERLYMRAATDFRPDDIIKIEMLQKIRVDGFDPVMAFDDRNRVVAAWRSAGIPCAQVADGDF